MMLGTRVAETILASGYVRPYTKAGHMSASDPIKSLLNNLARRVPSTYGVSRARPLNLLNDLGRVRPRIVPANEIAMPVSPRERSGSPLLGGSSSSFVGPLSLFHADTRPGALPKRNSVPLLHMPCKMTASLRATATRVRAMPRRLATYIPHALRLDHSWTSSG